MIGRLRACLPSRQCLQCLSPLMKQDLGNANRRILNEYHIPSSQHVNTCTHISWKSLFCFSNCVRCPFHRIKIVYTVQSLVESYKSQLVISCPNAKQLVSLVIFFTELSIQTPNSISFKNQIQLSPNKVPVTSSHATEMFWVDFRHTFVPSRPLCKSTAILPD